MPAIIMNTLSAMVFMIRTVPPLPIPAATAVPIFRFLQRFLSCPVQFTSILACDENHGPGCSGHHFAASSGACAVDVELSPCDSTGRVQHHWFCAGESRFGRRQHHIY